MQQWIYSIALLIGISGLLFIDWRYRLAFWSDVRRTTLTVVAGMGIFIVWDLIGIGLGVFFHGNSVYTLPLRLAPEFPIEELFFLFLLCYVTLVLYLGGRKVCSHI